MCPLNNENFEKPDLDTQIRIFKQRFEMKKAIQEFEELLKKKESSFNLELDYKQYLIEENFNDDLRKAFEDNGYPISHNTEIIKKNEKKWEIRYGNEIYVIKDTNTKLNIYKKETLEKELHDLFEREPWLMGDEFILEKKTIQHVKLTEFIISKHDQLVSFVKDRNRKEIDLAVYQDVSLDTQPKLFIIEIKRPTLTGTISNMDQLEEYMNIVLEECKSTNLSISMDRIKGILIVNKMREKLKNCIKWRKNMEIRDYSILLEQAKKLFRRFYPNNNK